VASTAAARRRRLGLLGAAALVAAGVVVVLILISSGGSDNGGGAGRPLEGTAGVNRLFEGVPQRGVTLGRADAPVTLVEFADLQCPFCAEYADRTLPTIVQRYVRSGRVARVATDRHPRTRLRQRPLRGGRGGAPESHVELQRALLRQPGAGELRLCHRALPSSCRRWNPGPRHGASPRRTRQRGSSSAACPERRRGGCSERRVDPLLLRRTGGSLAPLQPSSLEPSGFTGPLDKLLQGR
jgi:hypothetical protein